MPPEAMPADAMPPGATLPGAMPPVTPPPGLMARVLAELRTVMQRSALVRWAAMWICTGSRLGSTPCSKAFSSRGWSSMAGTSASPASGATSHVTVTRSA